jgi:cytochrome c oxidase assembly protein subunit 15
VPRDAAIATQEPGSDARYALRLARGFAALLACTFALIVLGALVRAHDAGLACPDWPLCFGEWIPRMDLRVAFEYSHRVLAGSVGLAFAALAALALRRPATRAACAGVLALAAALLCAQVLLGALTVWQLLAAWTVTAHLLTGNAFAATLLWIALALRERARPRRPAPVPPRGARAAAAAAAALLALQLLLGGLVASRYAGLACPEFPTCRDGVWLPGFAGPVGLQLAHRLGAAALLAGLAALALCARAGAPALRRPALLACALALAQVGVGAANVWLRLPVEVTGLHSALAAALVLTLAAALRASFGHAT